MEVKGMDNMIIFKHITCVPENERAPAECGMSTYIVFTNDKVINKTNYIIVNL